MTFVNLVNLKNVEDVESTETDNQQSTSTLQNIQHITPPNTSSQEDNNLEMEENDTSSEDEAENAQQEYEFFKGSVIRRPVRASSEDFPNQSIHETRNMYRDSFWSSKGSKDDNANEYLIYMLKEPDCTENKKRIGVLIIKQLVVKYFKAHWQNDNIYTSKKV